MCRKALCQEAEPFSGRCGATVSTASVCGTEPELEAGKQSWQLLFQPTCVLGSKTPSRAAGEKLVRIWVRAAEYKLPKVLKPQPPAPPAGLP